jgi:hypothetical protein
MHDYETAKFGSPHNDSGEDSGLLGYYNALIGRSFPHFGGVMFL